MQKLLYVLVMLAGSAGTMLAYNYDPASRAEVEAETATKAKPVTEKGSVASYCVAAIPEIWDLARDAGEDVDSIKGKLAYTVFDYSATNYCHCNQEWLGENRSSGEKALFGKFAGLNLKMQFSNIFTRAQREELQKEAQSIGQRHRNVLERKPKWLKEVNRVFRMCKEEQDISKKLSAYGL